MFVPFNSLGDAARIWIYQAGRTITEAERNTISESLSAFTESWAAHGVPLKTSFAILYDQFIVLAADEAFNEASGCSIDGSVRVMNELDQKFGLNLFDRTNVVFLKEGKPEVMDMRDLSKALEEGRWNRDTLVFNNVIGSKGELKSAWVVPAGLTWLKRYLTKITV